MFNAPKSLKSANTKSVRVPKTATHGQGKSDFPSSTACDLGEANAFCESYGKPHVPVSVAFGGERLHVCRLQGSWDLDRAVAENTNALFRSIRKLPSKDTVAEWDDLTFQFGPRAFLYADKDRIVGFASTPIEAERLVTRFAAHLFRHTLASRMLQQGANLRDISEVLRHRAHSSTEIYAKIDMSSLNEVVRPWPARGGAR